MKGDLEKYFKKGEEKNPFKDCVLGVWHSHYTYFCPNCGKPVELCVCSLKKFKKND
jgi:hypothetical protein